MKWRASSKVSRYLPGAGFADTGRWSDTDRCRITVPSART